MPPQAAGAGGPARRGGGGGARPARGAPATATTRPKSSRKAIRHVVIISEDGLRPDALTGVKPPVHEEIFKRAAYSLKAQTIRRASTLPSHAAMLSGFDIKEHGLFWNSWKPERGFIQVPSVFDVAEKNGGSTAAFVGKQKLAHIANPNSVDKFSRPGYFCRKVVDEAARYFVEKKPQIEFIHFSDPDDLGHSDGWMSNPQLEAVRATDKCLGTLLDAVAKAGLDSETLFIISADHGGHGRQSLRKDQGGPPHPVDRLGPGRPPRPSHQERDQHHRHGRDRAVGARLPHPRRRGGQAPSSKPSSPSSRGSGRRRAR